MHVSFFAQVKAETDQFIEGLEVLGIISIIKRCPEIMKPLFTPTKSHLSKGIYHFHSQVVEELYSYTCACIILFSGHVHYSIGIVCMWHDFVRLVFSS